MKVWCAVFVLLAAGVAAADDPALAVVDACRAKLDPRLDTGVERIARRCPELLPALERAPWRDLLPAQMRERREELSAESLRALSELVRHAHDAGLAAVQPHAEFLAPVLKELGAQGKQGATRWERFKKWLKEKLEHRRADEPGWLEQWARQWRTSEGVARAVTYIGYACAAALVVFVLLAELRAAGLLGGARRGERESRKAAEWRRRLALADIARAPLAAQPGMLLRLLGEVLARGHRLPAPEGLSAGVIARRAELDTSADRAALTDVAVAADEIRYADRTPPEPALESAVDAAHELLARLGRAPVRR